MVIMVFVNNLTAMIIKMLSRRPHTSGFGFLFCNFFGNFFAFFLVMTFTYFVGYLLAFFNVFIGAAFLGGLSANFSFLITGLTFLFIGGAAYTLFVMLAMLMMFCMTHILGNFMALVVILGDMGQMLVVLAYFALINSLV